MALARIYGLYPTTDLFLHCRRLGAYEKKTLVSAHLSSQKSTEPIQNPIHTFTNPRPVRLTKWHLLLDCLNTYPFAFLSASPSPLWNKNPSDSPSQGQFPTSNQSPLWTPQLRYSKNIPNNHPYGSLIWGLSKISNQTSFHITQIGSNPNLPRKPTCPHPSSYPVPLQAKFHHNTPAKFLKINPWEPPSTPPTYHPYLFFYHVLYSIFVYTSWNYCILFGF